MNAAEPVHQVVFRWDAGGDGGPPGMRPVARSCEAAGAGRAFELAGAALWGGPGLVRLVNRDAVLLLHRVPGQDPTGRATSWTHCLLGSRSTLPPLTSLGLHGWDWPGADLPLDSVRGPLPPVDPWDLREAARRPLCSLRRSVPSLVPALATVVAAALRQPDRRLSVLDRDGDAVPTLVGFCDVLGWVLAHPLTFASRAEEDLEEVRIAFVPGYPDLAPAEADTAFVDPADGVEDWALEVARRLIELQLNDARRFEALQDRMEEVSRGVELVRRIAAELDHPVPVAPATRPRPYPPRSTEVAVARVDGGGESRLSRWLAPPVRVAPLVAAERERLLDELTTAVLGRAVPASVTQVLAALDDESMLAGLHDDIPWPVAEHLMSELAARAPQRPRRAAQRVCCAVLMEGLYVGRWPDAPPEATAARELFDRVVRPWLRFSERTWRRTMRLFPTWPTGPFPHDRPL